MPRIANGAKPAKKKKPWKDKGPYMKIWMSRYRAALAGDAAAYYAADALLDARFPNSHGRKPLMSARRK